jgi:hypothetical protein
MAKTTKPPAKVPEEKKTWTAEEHNFTMIMDRILTWQSISYQRSFKERDPANLIDASEALRVMITNEKVQDLLRSIYAKPKEDEKDDGKDEDDTTPPGQD